jgi:hypothetical protein
MTTRLEPQRSRCRDWVDRGFAPPLSFIAVAVKFAMMPTAERDGELVADLASKRSGLGKAQVMGVTGLATADKTGLLRHMADVVTIADPARLGEWQKTLVDRPRVA